MVPCPSWLKGRAVEHWQPLCEMLFGLGLMSAPYSVGLALLVDALADWIEYTESLLSAIDLEEKGYYATRKEKAWERVLKACREFGITPSAATGVKSLKGDENKPKGLSEYKLG
jgi:phage terminase small subunit